MKEMHRALIGVAKCRRGRAETCSEKRGQAASCARLSPSSCAAGGYYFCAYERQRCRPRHVVERKQLWLGGESYRQ